MANRKLPPEQPYSGRHPGVAVKALSLDRDAVRLLAEMAPTPKTYGAFVSGLLRAEYARREERAKRRRVRGQLSDVEAQLSLLETSEIQSR
jgi:hypothetical protein